MKKFIMMLMTLAVTLTAAQAQVVTYEPDPLTEDATEAVIYFHADQGDQGLLGTPQSEPIYAHTGVEVTNAAGTVTSWKYAPTWGDNDDKYALSYVSENLWKLYLGDLREYYGVAQDETINKLCFVFRNADNSRTGRDEGGGDIFVDVSASGFQLSFRQSRLQNIFTKANEKLTFTATTTEPATIVLYVNDAEVARVANETQLRQEYTFPGPGEYVVNCQATNGTQTIGQTLNLLYINDSKAATDQTIPAYGVTKNADGSYTFCFAAPEKNNMVVVGSWNDFVPRSYGEMEYVDEMIEGVPFRHFKTTVPASEIKGPFSYYYLCDARTAVGDPYARLVLDPSNDRYISDETYPDMPQYPEGKVPNNTMLAYWADNLLDYKWDNTAFKAPDKRHLVIYEMLFRDFTGTEGKALGDGTVRQAIEKIPYLKELGINAVELLPINEFNGNISWGYNPNFYFATDKAYGTPQDYKAFIDACHAQGIAVILDIVFNQTDGNHPWYRLYPSASNPFYNRDAPHAFSVLNDWNQGYPLVQRQFEDCLKFWLSEYKVDGFRFDLVKGLGDNDSYSSSSASATGAYNASRVARMKKLHNAMREVNPDAYFINENLAGAKEENEMAEDGELNWANVNNAGCQFAMGYSSDSSLNRCNAAKDSRTPGSTVSYLESHDEQRMAYKVITWGVAGVKDDHAMGCRRLGSAAAQLILVPGAHMLWQFQELGNNQNTKSSNGDNNTGPKIVNWALLDDPDNKGLYDSYSELIHLRLGNPDMFPADKNFANDCSGWGNGRTITASAPGKEMYCVVNPNIDKELTVEVPFAQSSNDAYKVFTKSYDTNPSYDTAAKTVTVPAGGYVVVTTANVTAVKGIAGEKGCFNISVTPGHVTVTGSNGMTYIYGISGAKVASLNGDGTVSLPAGIYVVRNAERTVKILVK